MVVVVLPFGGDERARAFKTRLYENVYYGAKARERHTLTVSPFLRFSGGQKTREKNNTQNTIEWISLSFSSRSFLLIKTGSFFFLFALFFPSLKKK